MENIVRLSPETILMLAERLTAADLHGRSVRIMTGTDGQGRTYVKWDAGSGWTPPYYGVDLLSPSIQSCKACNYEAAGKFDGAASTPHTCGQ